MTSPPFAFAHNLAGTADTRLIVLRGNSASGKTTVAAELRERYGRGIALVGQDNLRRVVLRERDTPDGANIGLINLTARYALDQGFHVVLEGILYTAHYGPMIEALCRDHRGHNHLYYLNVPFEETLRRHATKPQANEYGETEMRDWYRPLDLLPGGVETVIPADSSLAETTDRVMRESGLEVLKRRDTPGDKATS
ncbi:MULTISPECIES: AAA family ATPase [Streptomyces]|uniref:AAA family ATPase n=1 Tax=Streptomyces TaxID=1883 RepID=UPI00163D2D5D|nr:MULTISPECIES: AAA family ATPase [Streptomyces]MBC2879525.1 kinase [Streptomyces sp. TYQ1024]UBI34997.1 kinase [Streptomyces mobaraensis]UKW27597.1 AAA family ATPase [Streptomyces sp. TYQ1024]